ncbi:MAG: UvrD-helicase domain-containing protein [Bacteroidales bacterium]|jgi:ATP-dependent exoDNAse (exonuclease V) beta subunit|nr:UvrD-helicase domain-containing protein [Bacteroidales bacterium]
MSTSNQKSFIVYQASAGAGKTYTLAKEYIKLCLMYYPKDPFLYRKILGITFTNKAVNEMKERILLFLELLSSGEADSLSKELSEFVDEQEIPARTKEILHHIHHDYNSFSIYTIDSLFQRIIQSFAIDLKIPVNHQLELDTDSMMSLIIDLLLSKLGYDHAITNAIINFSFSNIEDGKNWHVEKELATVGKEIYNETAIPYLKKLKTIHSEDFVPVITQINEQIVTIENTISNAAKIACNIILENDIQFTDFYQGTNGIGKWFYTVNQKDYKNLSGNSYVAKAINEDVWYSSSCKNKEAIQVIAPILKDCYLIIAETEKKYRLLKAIRKNIYPVVLLNEIKHIAEDLKRNNKLIHISEANLSIFESIKNEPVPFIYERIGEKYKYIFIDEFQDTSTIQWQNLLPLVTEILSSVLFKEELGKVIIFGDAKQAIYRFRGGNALQFVTLPQIDISEQNPVLKETESILKRNYEKMFLQTNYRSKKEVVMFNNSFFEYVIKNIYPQLKDIYLHAAQKIKEENGGGAVFLSCLLKSKENKIQYVDFINEEIYRIIQLAQADNYNYDDIVILVRGNDFSAEIARNLLKENIPTISKESLLLSKNKEVNFLIACLSYLMNNNDDIARVIILDFIVEKQGLQNKEDILIHSKHNAHFKRFIQDCQYNFNVNRLCEQNLYERVEQLLQIFHLTEQEANPFILAFLDIVANFLNMGDKIEVQFLDYWEDNKNKFSLSNPKGLNAVTVMTIHQSKGLEFPIVIYPHKKEDKRRGEKWVNLIEPIGKLSATILKVNDMENTIYNDLYEEEQQLSLMDELNIDYVAFTRAKDRLYFIAKEGDTRGDSLRDFLSDNSNCVFTLSENETVAYYCFGKPQPKPASISNLPQKENYIKKYISKPIFVNSNTAKYNYLSPKNTTSATWWGTKVHDYLAKIYHQTDIDPVLTLIRNDVNLTLETKENLLTVIQNIFSNPLASVLFGSPESEIKNEVELINTDGKSFRIDRLQINGDKCVVIDYKTGLPHKNHHSQIDKYKEILSAIGYEVTNKYLIYIDDAFNVNFLN